MKHHCRYCGEKLMEDEDRVTGTCDRCIYEFETVEDDWNEGDEWFPCVKCGEYVHLFDYEHECKSDYVKCSYCSQYYDSNDPYSECGCYWGGDDE